ncbi:MAG: cyclic nucleotide-binding domain-containing protein [Candidatus Omnitrophica bacterium]|nr:cyclic nucleotide-binding domain-containing protein [Candidatus Omnitrophota bacterium]
MLWGIKKAHTVAKKITSLIVIVVFMTSFSVKDAGAVAEVPEPVFSVLSAPEQQFAPLNVETFTVPQHLGTMKFTHNADSDKLIIHIQDAHCNYGAQKKISEIISYLVKEYGITDINLEGGVGEYDLSIFTGIADRVIREKVADHFVKQGLVSGPEYYAVNHPFDVRLWGIEDPVLYMNNISVYWESEDYKEQAKELLGGISRVMDLLKKSIYTPQLLEVDTRYEAYKQGELQFKDYLSFLMQKAKEQMIDPKDYPNIYLLYQSLNQEGGIDFQAANTQRDLLVDQLERMLSRKALDELVMKTIDFKVKKISQFEFYDFLVKKAKLADISLDEYPDLQKYIVYITLYHAADRFAVMEEMDRIEADLKSNLYQNNEQRRLNGLSRNLTLMKNLFALSLTKEDYKYYKQNRDAFRVNNFSSFIDEKAPVYNISVRSPEESRQLDRYRADLERFYEYSFGRDEAFLENINFTDRGKQAAIVVTGGFHTENLCDLYKQEDISYVSIIPDFKNEKGYECPYFDLLSGKISGTYEKMYRILSEASLIQVASFLSPLGEDVWDRRSIDAFKAAVIVVTQNQKAIAEGNEIVGIERKGEDLVLRMKKGRPITMPLRELLHRVHERETDQQMEAISLQAPESFKDIPEGELDDIINNDLLPFLEAMGISPDVEEIVKGLTGNSVLTGLPLVRTVEGVNFEGTPGGYGIRINAKYQNADGRIGRDGRSVILHEIVGGIYGDHILAEQVEQAYRANDRRDKLLADETPLKKPDEAGELVTAAVWQMEAEERLEVDRDYTAPLEGGLKLTSKMLPAIRRQLESEGLITSAKSLCRTLDDYAMTGYSDKIDSFASSTASNLVYTLARRLRQEDDKQKAADELVGLVNFLNGLQRTVNSLSSQFQKERKAEIQKELDDFFLNTRMEIGDMVKGLLNDAEIASEIARVKEDILPAMAEGRQNRPGLSPVKISKLSTSLERLRSSFQDGKIDAAQDIADALQRLVRDRGLSREQEQLLASGRNRMGVVDYGESLEVIENAFQVEGSDLNVFFNSLSREDRDELVRRMSENLGVTYIQPGETFIKAGTPDDNSAYFVLSGGYRVDYPLIGSRTKNTVFQTDNGAGQMVGEIALVHRTRRNADVVADTPMRVLVMTEDALDEAFKGRPDLEKAFFEAIDAVVEDRQEQRRRETHSAKFSVVGPIGREQFSALESLISEGIVTVERMPSGEELESILQEALDEVKKTRFRDEKDKKRRDEAIDRIEELMEKGAADLSELMEALETAYRKSIVPILKDLMDEKKKQVAFRVNRSRITDPALSRVDIKKDELDFKTLNTLINVEMTEESEIEDLQKKLQMMPIGYGDAIARRVRRDSELFDRAGERRKNLEGLKNALATSIDGILNIYDTRGLLRYDRTARDEGYMIRESLERMIDLYLMGRMDKPLRESDVRKFVDLLSYSLNMYVLQKGGVQEVAVTDEDGRVVTDADGNPVTVSLAYGSGGNRLRGSNGAIHAIMNSDKVDAMARSYNAELAEARKAGRISQEEYESRFITPELLLEARVALMMHDAMAGNIRNANAGLGIFGDVEDLKAGHGAAATKYLNTEDADSLFTGLFGADGKRRIADNIAFHDYTGVDFSTPEAAVMTMTEVADNTAAAEKFMDAFTRVPANNGLLGKLHELAQLCTIDGKLNKGLYARLLEGIREQMIDNIERAARQPGEDRLTPAEAQTYKYTVMNDLNIMTAGMSLAAYNAGAFRLGQVEFDLDVQDGRVTDVTMSVVQERGYSDEEFKALFGENLADKHLKKITAEPYGSKDDSVKPGDQIGKKGLVMKITRAVQVNTEQAKNAKNLVGAMVRARREAFNLMGTYDNAQDLVEVVKLYFGLSDHEMEALSENLGGPAEVADRFMNVISLDEVNQIELAETEPAEGILEPEIIPAESYPYEMAVDMLLPATPQEMQTARGVLSRLAAESPATSRKDLMRVRSLDEMNDRELEYLEKQLEMLVGNKYKNTSGRIALLAAAAESVKDMDSRSADVQEIIDNYGDAISNVNRLAWSMQGSADKPGPWRDQFGSLSLHPWRKPIVLAKATKVFERMLYEVMEQRARNLRNRVERTRARIRTAEKEQAWVDKYSRMLAEAEEAVPALRDALLKMLGVYYWMDRSLGKEHVYNKLPLHDRFGETFSQARAKGLTYLIQFDSSDFLGPDKVQRYEHEIAKLEQDVNRIRFSEQFSEALIEKGLAAKDWGSFRRYTLPVERPSEKELAALPGGLRVAYEKSQAEADQRRAADREGFQRVMGLMMDMAAGRDEAIDSGDPRLLHMIDMAVLRKAFDSVQADLDEYGRTKDLLSLHKAYQGYFGEEGLEEMLSRITDATNKDSAATSRMKKEVMNFLNREDQLGRDIKQQIESAKNQYQVNAAIARDSIARADRIMRTAIEEGGALNRGELATVTQMAADTVLDNMVQRARGIIDMLQVREDAAELEKEYMDLQERVSQFERTRREYVQSAEEAETILRALQIDPSTDLGGELSVLDINELKERINLADRLGYDIFLGRGLNMLALSSNELDMRMARKRAYDISTSTEEAIQSLTGREVKPFSGYAEEGGYATLKSFVNKLVSWGVDIYGDKAPVYLFKSNPSTVDARKEIIDKYGLQTNYLTLTSGQDALLKEAFGNASTLEEALEIIRQAQEEDAPEMAETVNEVHNAMLAELNRLKGMGLDEAQSRKMLDEMKGENYGFDSLKGSIGVTLIRRLAVNVASSTPQVFSFLNKSLIGLNRYSLRLSPDQVIAALGDLEKSVEDGGYGFDIYRGEGLDFFNSNLPLVLRAVQLTEQQMDSQLEKGQFGLPNGWKRRLEGMTDRLAVEEYDNFVKTDAGKKTLQLSMRDAGIQDPAAELRGMNREAVDKGLKVLGATRERIVDLTQYRHQQEIMDQPMVDQGIENTEMIKMLENYLNVAMGPDSAKSERLQELEMTNPELFRAVQVRLEKAHLEALRDAGKPYQPYRVGDIDPVTRAIADLKQQTEAIRDKVAPASQVKIPKVMVGHGELADRMDQVRTEKELKDLVGEKMDMTQAMRTKINLAFNKLYEKMRSGGLPDNDPGLMALVENMVGDLEMGDEERALHRSAVINNIYLFNAKVEGEENYLLGFNTGDDPGLDPAIAGNIGLSAELVETLDEMELAEFIFHEMYEMDYGHEEIYGKTDRANSLQGKIFGRNTLKDKFRNFINMEARKFQLASLTEIGMMPGEAAEMVASGETGEAPQGDNAATRQVLAIGAGEEIERRSDPVRMVVGVVYNLEDHQTYQSVESGVREMNSELKAKFGEKPDNQQIITYKIIPGDTDATAKEYLKALERATRTLPEGGRIVSYTPQMEGLEMAEVVNENDLFKEYRANENVTFVKDAYTDGLDPETGRMRPPDIAVRFVLARQIAFCLNATNPDARRMGIDYIKDLLTRISGKEAADQLAGVEDINTLLDKLFLKIRAVDYEQIRDWQMMQEAVAVSL